jgi:LacI family transcriptional regulator
MEYRPNRLASGLRTNRTMTVGVMIPDITNMLFPPIVRGVESFLETEGYASIVVNTDNDPEREMRLMNVLRERGVDGVINAAVQNDDPRIEHFAEDIPCVTVNRKLENSQVPCVISDDIGGVRMMVRRLQASGHKRIAHIAGPPDLSTGVDRRAAFEAAMRAQGHPDPAELVQTASRYYEDEGARCTDALLDKDPGITAILCANDRLAIGALQALRARGLSCPEDVSLTGFNDIPFLDLIPPGLTTVQILQFDIGRTAAEILVKMMTAPDKRVPSTTILPVSIVERGSIGPTRRA